MIQFWHSEIDIQAVHNEFIGAHYLEASVSDHRLEEEKRVHKYKSLKYATRVTHSLFFNLMNESKYLETLILISCQHTNVM